MQQPSRTRNAGDSTGESTLYIDIDQLHPYYEKKSRKDSEKIVIVSVAGLLLTLLFAGIATIIMK